MSHGVFVGQTMLSYHKQGDHAKHREPNTIQNGFTDSHQCTNNFQAKEQTSNGFSHSLPPVVQKSIASHPEKKTQNGFVRAHHKRASNGYLPHEYGSGDCRKSTGRSVPVESARSYESFEQTPLYIAVSVYLGYVIIIVFGYLRDALQRCGVLTMRGSVESGKKGWVPLYWNHERFYARHIYRPLCDSWFRPVCGVPGVLTDIRDRSISDHGWTVRDTGKIKECINMGSYNYLGFAQTEGPCAQQTAEATSRYGCGVCSSQHELGTTVAHKELDELVAEFLGVEAAMTFGMGLATNTMNLLTLVGKGCLVLSDELNHASIILGVRLSKATIRIFKHNDMKDLEAELRKALIHGQPRTHRTWRKILIVCEGIYSMEASICKLPELIALKKKYGAYLYLDEAHSIGALGSRGRGVTEYCNCDPRDIDIMMGTFSKSFAACGGYIAGSKKVLNYLRVASPSACYAPVMPVPVVQQIIASMSIIMGKDGTTDGLRRLGQLAWNVRYFRRRLYEMGFIVFGNMDSPVVPLILYNIPKLAGVARMCFDKGLAVVTIGFPATNIIESRARLCLSAEHTKEMLDRTLDILDAVGDRLSLKLSRLPVPELTENDADFRARYPIMPDHSGNPT